MGLNDLKQKELLNICWKVNPKKLVDMTVTGFANETASESPAPGGGSISALAGALGISLATARYVPDLSSHKHQCQDTGKNFQTGQKRAETERRSIVFLVDEDTHFFQ